MAVPANMTHFFQLLDLTVNGLAKRKQFITYYTGAVEQQIDRGMQPEDIDVNCWLTVLKPLHAQWMVNMFNYFTTDKGK